MIRNRYKLVSIFVTVFAAAVIYSGVAFAQMTRVNNGTTSAAITQNAVCNTVINNGGNPIMVPWNSTVEWTEFRTHLPAGVTLGSCVVDCTGTPWGTVADGASVTGWQNASVACGSSCASQTRTCTAGVLSGTYANTSCSVNSCNCTGTPWGTVANGYSNIAYPRSTVSACDNCGNYGYEWRTCTNGTMSGTYAYTSCSLGVSCGDGCCDGGNGETCSNCSSDCTGCAPCTGTPWGTVASGYSNTAYNSSLISCTSSCNCGGANSQVRTCNNGTMSGSFTNIYCVVSICNYDNSCDGQETPDCPDCGCGLGLDCLGVCGGSATYDCAGVCNGSHVADCLGICNGSATVDSCGVCGGSGPGPCGCGRSPPCCGDGICNGSETQCSCAGDCGAPACGQCGAICGDGCCTGGEDACSCSTDCPGYCCGGSLCPWRFCCMYGVETCDSDPCSNEW